MSTRGRAAWPTPGQLGLKASIESQERQDLLALLDPMLDDRARRHVRAAMDEDLAHVQDQNDELRSIWADLQATGAPLAQDVLDVCSHVDAVLLAGQSNATLPLALLKDWIRRVADIGREALRGEIDRVRAQARNLGDVEAEPVLAALERSEYADAVRLVARNPDPILPVEIRETVWRTQAERSYDDPRALIAASDLPLAKRWLEGVTGNSRADQPLSRLFAEYTVGDDLRTAQRTAPFSQVVACEGVASHLAKQKLNPCFLPQLAAYGQLVISVLTTKPQNRSFVRAVAGFVATASRDGDSRTLAIVLAPGLSRDARNRALAEVRTRGLHAAFIDDLDLWRLISPTETGRDPLIGLLELALEQQPLDLVNPFGAHDGQAVRMEMYVGRTEEAMALTSPGTTRYSLLFSGRKLGKSALLRFISDGEHTLPSGNKLHVVYVPIVGLETDRSVVSKILETLDQSLGMSGVDEEAEGPFERLNAALGRFQAEHPSESLLFVLDEADVFVENQLVEYESDRERCLSFMMRTMTESVLDGLGVPVVRFLFSGYRATNTREGPWANWGDCLVLRPLEERDAIQLVVRPLARLGVDATAFGPSIAHRCGHQPAVLLRFGNVLLTELAKKRMRGDLSKTITADRLDIAKAFSSELVQEEIRAVARNNFQGNEAGFVIFNALLMAFAADGPNAEIVDLEDRIVDLLDDKDGFDQSVNWEMLTEGFDSPAAFVRRRLDDLVERQLITRSRHRDALRYSYRLRFPHHLPTLLRWEPRTEIAQLLRSMERSESGARASRRSMISEDQMEEIREWCSRPAEIHEAFVVASSWEGALAQSAGGIGDRLGMVPRSFEDGPDHRLYVGLSEHAAVQVLHDRDAGLPPPVVIGGPSVLRWALQRRPTVEAILEIYGVGRLSPGVIRWWFGRVRGLEFETTNALEQVHAVTGGVPYLVGKFDEVLLDGGLGGMTVSGDLLESSLRRFGQERADAMLRLSELADLTAREWEILWMVRLASNEEASPGSPIGEYLMPDLWAELCQDEVSALTVEDALSVEYLALLGFVPYVRGGRAGVFRDLASVAPDDPVSDLETARN